MKVTGLKFTGTVPGSTSEREESPVKGLIADLIQDVDDRYVEPLELLVISLRRRQWRSAHDHAERLYLLIAEQHDRNMT